MGVHYIDYVYKILFHTNVNFPPFEMFDIKLSYSRFELTFHSYDMDTQFWMTKGAVFENTTKIVWT